MEAKTITEKIVDRPSAVRNMPVSGARVQVRNVSLSFGGHVVLHALNFDVRPGELVLLRGENGSGKTVLFNLLSGYLSPDQGEIRLELAGTWVNPSRLGPERLARRGVGRLWQDIRLFPTMTVLDNVLAATPGLLGQNPAFALFARPALARQEHRAREQALENLSMVGMVERAQSSCDMLSVGQMKRVALARLLQMEASLLLLDEPLAGLDIAAVRSLSGDLSRLRELGKTVLVVEHRSDALANSADRVWRLNGGGILEIRARPCLS
jgi:ABC-type branched-subunit amino acid transport system ATPase component